LREDLIDRFVTPTELKAYGLTRAAAKRLLAPSR
jgi:hypothetical protein